jgi:hypothetical protein
MKKSTLAALLAACVAFAVSGCSRDPEETSRSVVISFLEARADTGIELRVLLPRDTIFVADRGPVALYYTIVNGPTPTQFDNHPHRFGIRVTGPNGQPAKSLGGAGPATGAMGRFQLLLPAHGSLVQRQDLRCVSDGAYSTMPPEAPHPSNCLAMYAFRDPGVYKLVVEYVGPSVWPNVDSITAAVDRGEALLDSLEPIARGQRLADTATLVVVDE